MKISFKFLFFICFPFFVMAQNSTRNLGKENWLFRKQGASNWNPATVPGTVHTDLFNNKVIPDPFFGANEKNLQWIEREDWEYQTTFLLTGRDLENENIALQFDGLDTYAAVYLNGNLILQANNMFRIWKVEVKNQLKVGQNTLVVIFKAAVQKGKEDAKKLTYTLPGDEKVFTRKAQYHYGWDWGPRFVTSGIWKNVQLQFWNSVKIENVKYEQKSLTNENANLLFVAKVWCEKPGNYCFKIKDKSKYFALTKGANRLELNYEIQNPKRWWSNGLGEAYLYPFTISISDATTILDVKELNIGLRTLELMQETDLVGKSFYFKLNGVPVFMKGANYIPADSFLPRANDSVYNAIVNNAAAANMNMLRVWGGGVYADDAFYDACDRNGILVWQDFMFACAMYPGDAAFLANVKQEVIDNVNRLQNHPSIALWCGNNENDEGWHNWDWQKQFKYSKQDSIQIWSDYKKLFHELIPSTLDSLLSADKNRYWPSSPSIGWGKKESQIQGDMHYWGVWWGMEPFEMYTKKVGRFMSEYGFQGMPHLETFQKFANGTELNFSSEAVKNHQKHGSGYKIIKKYLKRDFKIPTTFSDYIYVSQLVQAHGMKTAIEAHRRSKPYCMGTLYWQLNDCWPVTSWSSVDYFGNWKAFHYQAKRSYDAVLVSFEKVANGVEIHVVNDELQSKNGKLNLKVINFEGKELWSDSSNVQIAPNSSSVQFVLDVSKIKKFNPRKNVLSASLVLSDKETKSSVYYFEKPKRLKLRKPSIAMIRLDENTYELTTDVLAKNVFLTADKVHFSDNYFDLLPGEKKFIKVNTPSESIKIQSLYNAFNE